MVVPIEPVLPRPHHPVPTTEHGKILVVDRSQDKIREIGVSDTTVTGKFRDLLDGGPRVLRRPSKIWSYASGIWSGDPMLDDRVYAAGRTGLGTLVDRGAAAPTLVHKLYLR